MSLSFNRRLDTDPVVGACLFHKWQRELGEYSADGGDQAGFGVVGGHVGDVLDVWPNKVVQRVQVGGAGGASERRVQSRSISSEAKPGSLWTWTGAESCCYTQGLPPATRLRQGITTLFSTSRYTLVLTFKPTSKMWGGMIWPSLETTPKTITVAENFVFITLGTSLLFVAIQICILRVLAMVLLS